MRWRRKYGYSGEENLSQNYYYYSLLFLRGSYFTYYNTFVGLTFGARATPLPSSTPPPWSEHSEVNLSFGPRLHLEIVTILHNSRTQLTNTEKKRGHWISKKKKYIAHPALPLSRVHIFPFVLPSSPCLSLRGLRREESIINTPLIIPSNLKEHQSLRVTSTKQRFTEAEAEARHLISPSYRASCQMSDALHRAVESAGLDKKDTLRHRMATHAGLREGPRSRGDTYDHLPHQQRSSDAVAVAAAPSEPWRRRRDVPASCFTPGLDTPTTPPQRRGGSLQPPCAQLEDTSMFAYYLSHMRGGGDGFSSSPAGGGGTAGGGGLAAYKTLLRSAGKTADVQSLDDLSSISACSHTEVSAMEGSLTRSLSLPGSSAALSHHSSSTGVSPSHHDPATATTPPQASVEGDDQSGKPKGAIHPTATASSGAAATADRALVRAAILRAGSGVCFETRVTLPRPSPSSAAVAELEDAEMDGRLRLLQKEFRQRRNLAYSLSRCAEEVRIRQSLVSCFAMSCEEIKHRTALMAEEETAREMHLQPLQAALEAHRRHAKPPPPARRSASEAKTEKKTKRNWNRPPQLPDGIDISISAITSSCSSSSRGSPSPAPVRPASQAEVLHRPGTAQRQRDPHSWSSRSTPYAVPYPYPRVESIEALFRSKELRPLSPPPRSSSSSCSTRALEAGSTPSLPTECAGSSSFSTRGRHILASIITQQRSASVEPDPVLSGQVDSPPRHFTPPIRPGRPTRTTNDAEQHHPTRCASCEPACQHRTSTRAAPSAGASDRILWSAVAAATPVSTCAGVTPHGAGLRDQLHHLYACTDWAAAARPRIQHRPLSPAAILPTPTSTIRSRSGQRGSTPTRAREAEAAPTGVRRGPSRRSLPGAVTLAAAKRL
eukprot:gene2307-1444_t